LAPKIEGKGAIVRMGKQTAFFLFSNEQRPKLKAQFPKLKLPAIAKKIGKLWHALSPEERAIYQEKAKNQ
jgi:hypothetical protein